MRIVFDRQILLGAEAFRGLGELRPLPQEELGPQALRDADALVVRSVTRVDAALVAGSGVRFVGSVTAGVDHVEVGALAARGIRFVHAPGCNAESVSTYVAAAVLGLAARGRLELRRCRMGIVGRGEVGGRVARWAAALGLRVVACDPPRRRAGEPDLSPLEEALSCEIVSLHVPYTAQGPDATAGMIDAAMLRRMPRGAWLVHTCRGGVVDEAALEEALASGRLGGAVIDVWADEPDHRRSLAARAEIATPHIAGHSLEGKANGTWQVREALGRWLAERGAPVPPLPPEALLPPGPVVELPPALGPVDAAARAVGRSCDPWADGRAFAAALARAEAPEAFRAARRAYAARRDPAACTIRGAGAREPLLRAFGFRRFV